MKQLPMRQRQHQLNFSSCLHLKQNRSDLQNLVRQTCSFPSPGAQAHYQEPGTLLLFLPVAYHDVSSGTIECQRLRAYPVQLNIHEVVQTEIQQRFPCRPLYGRQTDCSVQYSQYEQLEAEIRRDL